MSPTVSSPAHGWRGTCCGVVVLLVAALAASGCRAPAAMSGPDAAPPVLAGRVWLAPACAAERPDDPACERRPLQATLVLQPLREPRTLVTIETDDQGRFRVVLDDLAPGRYRLHARAPRPGLPPYPPGDRLVELRAGVVTTLELVYDSGVR